MKLQTKLALFNLLSKLVFSALFIGFLPLIIERINTLQTDRELIDKREEVISLISEIGLDPLITSETETGFGSYNILKEEFISLERADQDEDWNFIEVATRIVDEETIDYRVLNYSIKIDGQTYLLEIGKSLSSIRYAAKNIRTVILLFLAFFIAVTLVTDLTYTARLLRPLRIITRRLGTTSSPSLTDFSPVVTSTKDFRQLDQTLRDLMMRIEELFRKEKEITVNISHELMTPVSILRSKLENMLLKNDLDPEIEIGIDESLRTLHRLKTLINSLLMIARLESRQYLKEDKVNLEELVTEVTGELSHVAADAGVRIKSECTGNSMFAKANRSLLFSMLYNVVNNSIKHTPPEGSIHIRGERTGEKYCLFITDTGRGMTEKQLEIIFSRFRTKLNPEIDSTGIGLAITKSIADFHAIEIKVTSEPEKGTEFSFIFP